jgi:hypothetical protein
MTFQNAPRLVGAKHAFDGFFSMDKYYFYPPFLDS